jgi:cellulose synthase/poly-beta-1,6-N-acetylglucosamine synthase-like glycosyltransferase
VLWFWLLTAPAIVLALLSLRGETARAAYVSAQRNAQPRTFPPASVIVPIKGDDEGLRENLASLATLDYPDYELILVARTAEDIPPGVLPRRARIVFAQGSDRTTSEKIQNLMAAVRVTRKQSEIFAFADSDGRVPKGWLRSLAAALERPGAGAATGYRWFSPARGGVASLLRAAWNSVIGGSFGPGDNHFAWGGATAIRKDAFFDLRIFEYWKTAVSDDYALSAAVHAADLNVVWAPGATVVSTDGIGMRALLEWTRRQLTITRVYAPALWGMAFAAHVIYCAGMAAAVAGAALGQPWLLWILVPMVAPGMVKGYLRAHDRRWLHALLVPAATWLWMLSLALSAFGDTIVWRGYRYTLARPAWVGKRG